MSRFMIMGSQPGDGGEVVAKDFKSAFIKYMAWSWDVSQKEVREQMAEDSVKMKKISNDLYEYGDYEIKRI